MTDYRPRKGDRVAVRHGLNVSYGSHATGWSHGVLPPGTVVTVDRVGRWYVTVVSDDGGRASIGKASVSPAGS
jgi:hypothetical protein